MGVLRAAKPLSTPPLSAGAESNCEAWLSSYLRLIIAIFD